MAGQTTAVELLTLALRVLVRVMAGGAAQAPGGFAKTGAPRQSHGLKSRQARVLGADDRLVELIGMAMTRAAQPNLFVRRRCAPSERYRGHRLFVFGFANMPPPGAVAAFATDIRHEIRAALPFDFRCCG